MSDIGDSSQVSSMSLIKSIYHINLSLKLITVFIIYWIDLVEDLFSYNTIKRKRVLEYYFFPDATLLSPIMSTEGVLNIQ